jgi:hypothetical protein
MMLTLAPAVPWAAEKVYTSGDLPANLRPRDAWFTASADPK